MTTSTGYGCGLEKEITHEKVGIGIRDSMENEFTPKRALKGAALVMTFPTLEHVNTQDDIVHAF